MKLTICELSYLNELITSCVNTITCMSLFKNQVSNEELKSLYFFFRYETKIYRSAKKQKHLFSSIDFHMRCMRL